jgi:hypothetical protein
MTSARFTRRYARIVREIGVAASNDSATLSQAVAGYLRHPIILLPAPLPADAPCGLLISTGRAHYVVYDDTTGPLHQRHIVAHELGHLLAGHGSQVTLDTDVARLLMPSLDPDVVLAVLARTTGYDARAEREAEIIADLLWRHSAAGPAEPTWPVAPAAAPLVDRIRQSLTEG